MNHQLDEAHRIGGAIGALDGPCRDRAYVTWAGRRPLLPKLIEQAMIDRQAGASLASVVSLPEDRPCG